MHQSWSPSLRWLQEVIRMRKTYPCSKPLHQQVTLITLILLNQASPPPPIILVSKTLILWWKCCSELSLGLCPTNISSFFQLASCFFSPINTCITKTHKHQIFRTTGFQSFKIKQNKVISALPIVNTVMLMQWNLEMLFLDLIFLALP